VLHEKHVMSKMWVTALKNMCTQISARVKALPTVFMFTTFTLTSPVIIPKPTCDGRSHYPGSNRWRVIVGGGWVGCESVCSSYWSALVMLKVHHPQSATWVAHHLRNMYLQHLKARYPNFFKPLPTVFFVYNLHIEFSGDCT